jgi:hypothetical protein
MNERIFQLAKQAQIKFEAHLQHLGIDTAVITPADLEKFAELIVRECISVVTSKCASPTARNALIEHFGVEE